MSFGGAIFVRGSAVDLHVDRFCFSKNDKVDIRTIGAKKDIGIENGKPAILDGSTDFIRFFLPHDASPAS